LIAIQNLLFYIVGCYVSILFYIITIEGSKKPYRAQKELN